MVSDLEAHILYVILWTSFTHISVAKPSGLFRYEIAQYYQWFYVTELSWQ